MRTPPPRMRLMLVARERMFLPRTCTSPAADTVISDLPGAKLDGFGVELDVVIQRLVLGPWERAPKDR